MEVTDRCMLISQEFGNNNLSLAQVITLCTSINITVGDRLPQLVCTTCSDKIEVAYALKLQCQQAENILKQYLTQDNIPTNSVSSDINEYDSDITKCEELITADTALLHCTICSQTAEGNKEMINHMLTNHTENRIESCDKTAGFLCKVCNKSYLKLSNLKAHMIIHTDLKPFNCSICDRKFTQARAYACHLRTHAISDKNPNKTHLNKSFTCNVYGKNYSNSSNLKSHLRLHTGDKPYSCTICNKRFSQSNAHSYHMKTHIGEKPFPCDVCLKSFTTKGQLVNHYRLHTGERPFVCSICSKSFTQKVAHTVHMMTHTGNKPHLCNICGKKYAQNSQLVEHMRHHTGKNYLFLYVLILSINEVNYNLFTFYSYCVNCFVLKNIFKCTIFIYC